MQHLSQRELVDLAKTMGLTYKNKNKVRLRTEIKKAFQEYERYKEEKLDKYERLSQIGDGKEGKIYIVRVKGGRKYAMKQFSQRKSSDTLRKELNYQQTASKHGISPKIRDYDTVSKYIVMDLLDKHILEVLDAQQWTLTEPQQNAILRLFTKLDEIGIFHRDPNPLNVMTKDGKWYLVDYGFAVDCSEALKKKHGTSKLNYHFMTLGLLMKLKEINPSVSLEVLERATNQKR